MYKRLAHTDDVINLIDEGDGRVTSINLLVDSAESRAYEAWLALGNEPEPADPEPEPETPPAAILRLLLADVEDFDDVTKAILDSILVILGG